MITRQSENSKLKFKQTAFLATVYNISTPFPVRHAQSLFRSCIFTIQAAGVRFLPRPCFYGAITVYYKNKHRSHFIRKEIFYGYQIFRLGRRRLSVRPERRAQAQTRAQAPQVDRQQGRPHRGQHARHAACRRSLLLRADARHQPACRRVLRFRAAALRHVLHLRALHLRLSGHGGQGLLHVRQKAVHGALLCRGGAHCHSARRRADIVGRAAGQGLSSAAADRQRQLCKRN